MDTLLVFMTGGTGVGAVVAIVVTALLVLVHSGRP